MVLYNANCVLYCTIGHIAFEQFGALYMHNQDE